MRKPWLASTFLVLGTAASCSVLNAPEDLIAEPPATGGATGGDAGASGTGGSLGGSGGSSTFVPVPPTTGLLVLAAQDAEGERVLSVISTENGDELTREELPVAALAYDGAPDRYVWFVFKSADYPADPTKLADLEVRQFDEEHGEWIVLSTATALPPPRPDTLVVLNQRLAYLSHVVEASAPVQALTVLDTSDLEDVGLLGTSRQAEPDEHFVGLAGVRGSDVNPSATGGTLSLMIASDCLDVIGGGQAEGPGPDVSCELFAQPVFVANNVMDGVGDSLGSFLGLPRFASSLTDGRVFAALRTNTAVDVIAFPPNSPTPANRSETPTGSSAEVIGGFAVLECENAFVFTQGDEETLAALRFTGLGQTVDLGHLGGLVYVDPFDSLAFPFGPGGEDDEQDPLPNLGAYEVRGSTLGTTVPPAVEGWQAPADLVPLTGATRYPDTMSCD